MTICIACICASGKAIVAASDRMVSAPFLSIEFEHPASKIEQLDGSCVGLLAGDALVSTQLFSAVPKRDECWTQPEGCDSDETDAKGDSAPMNIWTVEFVANSIARTYSTVRNRKAEERVLQPRGLTLESFYSGGVINQIPEPLAMMLDNSIQGMDLGAEVIIAGIDDGGAHIYSVHEPGGVTCFDQLGYHAIGSGLPHALLALIGTEHSTDHTVNKTVFQVYEAKRRAEVAQGVGTATEMVIVTADGVKLLTEEEESVLKGIYAKKVAPKTKAIRNAVAGLPYGN